MFLLLELGLTDLQPLKNQSGDKIHVHSQANTEGMCPSASNTH